MSTNLAEAIALLRHQIISPVLMDSDRSAMLYFQQQSQKEFDVPGRGVRMFAAGTMRVWLYAFRKKGFQGLLPKGRSDKGRFRILSDEFKNVVRQKRVENLDLSCVQFYNCLLSDNLLGSPPIGLETLRRFLKSEDLYKKQIRTPRKRFEMRYFGELWTADFMHGPRLYEGKRRKKAILMAIIDDHSRLITGFKWGWAEDTQLLEIVFKEAILSHGCCDRFYCDNGSAFSSRYLALVCANLNIGLVHSKPYDSPSRGKIERFFRTVRDSFLSTIKEEDFSWNLNKINDHFQIWVRDGYHFKMHKGIEMYPIDRYKTSIINYPRKRINEEDLEEYFYVKTERSVGKDATLSLASITYEVPPEYIGKKVELLYAQDKPNEVFLYENNIRITKITPVDLYLNGQTYKPTPRISDIALHQVQENKK